MPRPGTPRSRVGRGALVPMSDRLTPAEGERGARLVPEVLPEGEEAPPRGVRVMAAVRWGLVALMAVAAGGAWLHYAGALRGAPTARAPQYRCPMHPSVLQSQPGDCPVCGMSLVPVEQGAGGAAPARGAASAAAAQGRYWCPMHPEVSSDDPNATCAKCGGMRLVPRAAPDASAPPGLVPVELGADRVQLTGLRTAPVRVERLGPELRTVGFVAANESAVAVVAARYTGWIEELRVSQSGAPVRKGQVLATAYSPELRSAQQILVNAVRWTQGQTNVAPVQTASGPEADARRRLDLLGLARQDIDEIAKSGTPLDAVPIRSPVSGYVARKSALVGLYVQPGTELFLIADLSAVWIVADVYEPDLDRVKVGCKARFVVPAYPGEDLGGTVQFIYPAVNPESHTVQARIGVRNDRLRLRPGMYGDVVIELPPVDALTVPADAVVDTGEVQYVFVVREGGRFEPRKVRPGSRAGDRVQILEGVRDGERVVTTANFLVDSESRLRAAVESFGPRPAGDDAPDAAHR